MAEGLQLGPEEVSALRAALMAAEARAVAAEAKVSDDAALIAHLKLEIAKLRRDRFGPSSERNARLMDQLELQLEELEASATADEIAAETAAAKATTHVAAFTRRRPSRQPFPEHLPRERVVLTAATSCPCCGGGRLSKLGEDVTETLEVIPRQWKVIATVRERFSCRDCETITQPPAPFHVTARGWAGPSLLAMIVFEKFGQHQPLNRQAERYAREGVPLSLSTLADQVGAVCMATLPIYRRLEAHVLAAGRLHGDDTTVPVLAAGKTARPMSPGYGPTSATTARSVVRRRRRRCSTTRAIGVESIPRPISPPGRACCRRTLMAATTSSMKPRGRRGASFRPCAGATAGASCSSWPTSPRARRKSKCATDAVISPDRPGGGEADRRRLRHRARDQRPVRRRAPGGAPGPEPTPSRRPGSLDARSARQALPP